MVQGAARYNRGTGCRQAAVVGFDYVAGADSDIGFVDGAGGVVHISDAVVATTVAVIHGYAAGGDGLARAGIGVGKGKGAATQTVGPEQLRTATGHNGRACRRKRAVVGLGNVAGGNSQIGLADGCSLAATGEGVVGGKTAIRSVAKRQGIQRYRAVGHDIFAGKGAAAGQRQRLRTDQGADGKDTGVNHVRAVVGTAAGQVNGTRIDSSRS